MNENEISIPLPNGNKLICGPGEKYMHGGYLRVENKAGEEIGYWDKAEWEAKGEGEIVIGAVFRMAMG